ncbi:MAG: D-sedoheptulose 7-phosphate isomerase [Bacteroidales bacterium]|nr:D-sedoheptulose 7-phosphate isomerase [Bacteroidales bacterium]
MVSVEKIIRESLAVKQAFLDDKKQVELIQTAGEYCIECYNQDGKILFCGNGGSAADAQHIAAELSARFQFDRKPLYAEALHVNSSYVTAVANDYDYTKVFSRMVEAAGRKGDILVALSTSGNSKNVMEAVKQAKIQGMTVIGLTGAKGGALAKEADLCFRVPSDVTARIQEVHILIGHILCEIIEETMFHKE